MIAHAAATAGAQCDGGFVLGAGSGEALDEHIAGDRWLPTDLRLSMMEEVIEVVRQLHRSERITHRGQHCTV